MNSDSFFTIGSTHKVCEDYALSVNECSDGRLNPFIALSDGCSSAPNTDFGSRILVKAIENLYCIQGISPEDPLLTELIWEKALNAITQISGLTIHSLDATLLFAYKSDKNINVVIIGDGAVSAKAKDGNIFTKTIEYKGNAPLYLSYLHTSDTERMKRREAEFDCTKIVSNIHHRKGNIINRVDAVSSNIIERFSFPIEDFDYVSIFSDGCNSFVQQEIDGGTKVNQSMPEHVIIEFAMDFKNNGGEFVRRRCQRFLKDLATANAKSTDDFTMTTIYTGE